MSRKKIVSCIAAFLLLATVAIVSIVAIVYIGIQIYTEPTIRELKTYTNGLRDIQRIEVFYGNCEWIRGPMREPESEEAVLTITEPDEIQQILRGFKRAERYYSQWTGCGFYYRLDLYGAEEREGIILVGTDDCKSFTTYDIHAVGIMGNDYFYREYIVPRRKNR